MTRLSKFQRQILKLLVGREAVTIRALVKHFENTTPRSPKTIRASLARAITRLQTRGLVERLALMANRRKAPAVRLTPNKKLTVSEIFGGKGPRQPESDVENTAVISDGEKIQADSLP